ncbi:MAG: HAMP domain-containing protein [Candidatus Omnitrophica bacterium]|nr:HAMP domain-containing protein [Candidatus Omnitrophota bacterium]
MNKDKKKFARRNYFVYKGFQLRFAATIFIATFIVSVIAVWTTYVTTWDEITQEVKSQKFYNRIKSTYAKNQEESKNIEMMNSIITVEFSEIFDQVSSTLLLRLLIGSFALFVFSVFVSHKIAGPLYRIQSAADAIRDGDLSVDLTNLRAGDELTDLAQTINGAIVKLRKLLNRYRDMAKKMAELAAEMSVYKEGGKVASTESTRLINELEQISGQLVTEINYFKTHKSDPHEHTQNKLDSAHKGRRK